jgi:hypothetical protein
MADVAVLYNNTGNNIYSQVGRDFLTSPIRTFRMRVLLSNEEQIDKLIVIRSGTSFGSQFNRNISLRDYISAMDKTNLIIDIPLDPALVIDGETYFQVELAPNSEIDFLFYFDQVKIENLLT